MNAQPLIRRLSRYVALTPDDERLVEEAARERVRRVGPREDVMREGERPRCLYLLVDGWGMRYKSLEDGRRQVLTFALPGDLCEQTALLLEHADHSLAAITPITVAEIAGPRLAELTTASPRLATALAWSDLCGHALQREWTVNLGQRTALERMAHLICELYYRLRAIGHTHGLAYELPATQAMLADATGISAVHVNRTLQELRAAELITLRGRHMTIHDLEALETAGLFNASYLHLDQSARSTSGQADVTPIPARSVATEP
ncbi:Crp/Fnr family transcriptional regulator [Salinarimonas ramus]|uniref:Crp/Fnr family transcriptional regulator n=1 Tax=Salinarimonas ramus TaxID=690164 RepID=A0A917Q3R5_9HYPH|nr:Crp/Fnr family transcriptional regulator [Salinarimonas ramus]GGK18461.1 Crp/Fnr family transcriptional regulator [Salinarimonas ramus]